MNQLHPDRKAWEDARSLSLIMLVCYALAFLGWRESAFVTREKFLFGAAYGLVVFLGLLAFRRQSRKAYTGVLVASVLLAIAISAATCYELKDVRHPGEIFIGFKLVALAVALIAPLPSPVGYTLLALCVLAAPVEDFLFFSEAVRHNLTEPEPWSTVMYALISVVVYYHRLREREYQRLVGHAEEKLRSTMDRYRKYQAIRDLANTPLQKLLFAIETLRRRYPDSGPVAERFEEAYRKLSELNGLLVVDAPAEASRDLSFDAGTVLESDQ